MTHEEVEIRRTRYVEATAKVQALENRDILLAANEESRRAYDALNEAERAYWGEQIVARLIGQTIVAVRNRGAFPFQKPNGVGETQLDESASIVLSNGVEICFYGDDNGGVLEVSEASTNGESVDVSLGPSTR